MPKRPLKRIRRDDGAEEARSAEMPGLTVTQASALVQTEMQAAQRRIDEVLSRVQPSTSTRPVLIPATAPAQAQSNGTPNTTEACTSCMALQAKLDDMQKQAAVHREERRAWQQFKTWWLDSLSKHQRRNLSSSALVDNSVDATSPHSKRRDPVSHMIADLDADARRIWEQAGVLSTEDKCDESVEESEPALTLHPPTLPIPSAAPISPSRVDKEKVPTVQVASTGVPQKSAKPSPLIRTTQPRTPTVKPTASTSAVGFVDGAPERNKHARRSMMAHDCPDCALFYSHFDSRVGGASTERQACSRHRTTFQRATTPQGYWNIAFPTTQDAEQINQDAREQYQQTRT